MKELRLQSSEFARSVKVEEIKAVKIEEAFYSEHRRHRRHPE